MKNNRPFNNRSCETPETGCDACRYSKHSLNSRGDKSRDESVKEFLFEYMSYIPKIDDDIDNDSKVELYGLYREFCVRYSYRHHNFMTFISRLYKYGNNFPFI